jgi:GGDEF domain-containing protein
MRILGRLSSKHNARQALVAKASEEAEKGRRLAIHDRATGLLAYWYFEMRFKEETERSHRYTKPLTIMLIETDPGDSYNRQDQTTLWLKRSLRFSDLASHLGDGRFLVLMTETDVIAAAALRARLHWELPEARIGLVRIPEDGETLSEVQDAASNRFEEAFEDSQGASSATIEN